MKCSSRDVLMTWVGRDAWLSQFFAPTTTTTTSYSVWTELTCSMGCGGGEGLNLRPMCENHQKDWLSHSVRWDVAAASPRGARKGLLGLVTLRCRVCRRSGWRRLPKLIWLTETFMLADSEDNAKLSELHRLGFSIVKWNLKLDSRQENFYLGLVNVKWSPVCFGCMLKMHT